MFGHQSCSHRTVVNGLDIDACMMSITRFMARRGRPHTIIGDNGTNCGSRSRVQKLLQSEGSRRYVRASGTRSHHLEAQPSGSSAFWCNLGETPVCSCKKSMFVNLGNRHLTWPVLTTTMFSVEQISNSRPFTAVGDYPEDLKALTPNHCLLGRPVAAEPLMRYTFRYVNCRKMYKATQAYCQMIWHRWEEYLPKRFGRPKWANEERMLKVGDLVLLIDESVRRHENKMARVTEVFNGADGVIRSTSIKTSDGVY